MRLKPCYIMKVCPKCGREYPDDLYFCRKCFEHLEPVSELPAHGIHETHVEAMPESKPTPQVAPAPKPSAPPKVEIKSIEVEFIDTEEQEEEIAQNQNKPPRVDEVGPPWRGPFGCFMMIVGTIISYFVFKHLFDKFL